MCYEQGRVEKSTEESWEVVHSSTSHFGVLSNVLASVQTCNLTGFAKA